MSSPSQRTNSKPSVEEIVARRRKLTSAYQSRQSDESKRGQMSPSSALLRALESANQGVELKESRSPANVILQPSGSNGSGLNVQNGRGSGHITESGLANDFKCPPQEPIPSPSESNKKRTVDEIIARRRRLSKEYVDKQGVTAKKETSPTAALVRALKYPGARDKASTEKPAEQCIPNDAQGSSRLEKGVLDANTLLPGGGPEMRMSPVPTRPAPVLLRRNNDETVSAARNEHQEMAAMPGATEEDAEGKFEAEMAYARAEEIPGGGREKLAKASETSEEQKEGKFEAGPSGKLFTSGGNRESGRDGDKNFEGQVVKTAAGRVRVEAQGSGAQSRPAQHSKISTSGGDPARNFEAPQAPERLRLQKGGHGEHMSLGSGEANRKICIIPPPRRRVGLSEYKVGEVVIIKRDRHSWVFARVRKLTSRGIKAWVPHLQITVNVPTELMYCHLRKLDDDLQGLSSLAATVVSADSQGSTGAANVGQEQGKPLLATLQEVEILKDKLLLTPPCRKNRLYLVTPAHLAHRHLYHPPQCISPCSICFLGMTPMEAHTPWDCNHSCHLNCFEQSVQRSRSSLCPICQETHNREWKSMACECGFVGFVEIRIDKEDQTRPVKCPFCQQLSLHISPSRGSPSPAAKLLPETWSGPDGDATWSDDRREGLPASAPGMETSEVGLKAGGSPKTWRRKLNVDVCEWRAINCDCGLRAIVRRNPDPDKSPICPACLRPAPSSSTPCKEVILRTLLGYSPPASTSTSPSRSSDPSPPLCPVSAMGNSSIPESEPPPDSSFPSSSTVTPQPSSILVQELSPSSQTSSLDSPSTSPSPSPSSNPGAQQATSRGLQSQSSRSPSRTSSVRPPLLIPGSALSDAQERSPSSPTASQLCSNSDNSKLAAQRSGTTSGTGNPGPLPISESPSSHGKIPCRPPNRQPRLPPTSSMLGKLSDLPTYRSHQLPADSLNWRITSAQLREHMTDLARKETEKIVQSVAQDPVPESVPQNEMMNYRMRKDLSATDSVPKCRTPAKIWETALEEVVRTEPDRPKFEKRDMPVDSMSLWMTPERIKTAQELQAEAGVQFPGPPSSTQTITEEDGTRETSHKMRKVEVIIERRQLRNECFKKLPLKLNVIPEDEEATQKLSPGYVTPSSTSASPASSSSATQAPGESPQLPTPMSLASRLQRFKAKAVQTASIPILPDNVSYPDQVCATTGNPWVTVVKDGQTTQTQAQKELELKAMEIENKQERH